MAILALLSIFGVTLDVGARQISRRFVFPGSEVAYVVPPASVAQLGVRTHDGATARALVVPGPPDAPVFVYFHNNRQTMVSGLGLARELTRRGFGVVLPEYRGYGVARREQPNESALYEDAEAILGALNARRIRSDRIVLCGMSLGTGVAAEMARRRKGAALMLIAPFTSLPGVVQDVVPLIPAGLFMPDKFDTLSKAPQIRVPTLVVHGDADEIIPFGMGRTVAGAIAGARFLPIHGGHHGDLFARAPDQILTAMSELAMEACGRASCRF